MKRLALIASLCATAPVFAQQATSSHTAHYPAPVQAQAQTMLVDGAYTINRMKTAK